VIRTRVGYAGGTTVDPTYYALGDHTETIQIDYDPAQISYEELLEVFWTSHSPAVRPWSRQYATLIFYHDEEQKRLAVESQERKEAETGKDFYTEIVSFSEFYLAEDYHQKYRLRQVDELMAEFEAIYPDSADFVNSTAAARVNGYVGGHGTLASLEAEIDDLGLSATGQEKLRDLVSSWER
jgi:methionine-S-sulfoxide reductase